MLSALAKYIFGGVIGDAPETTSMQYETREINDWLLVDMPDQDIDNEDMDSESDDDDILTAVPLLLAEEVALSPRQIVLSYEPDSSCDKSCAKIRKSFQDKSHSTSSKVQVHTGDKIQGNFVANVEAISLETDNISTDKLQHNLSKVQENVKSKQSKSKNFKPKKSKKSKINKKSIAKIQDTPVIIKKVCDDDVQEKINTNIQKIPNENKVLNLNEEIQEKIRNEIPENLGTENQCRFTNKAEVYHIAVINNSSHTSVDKFEENIRIAIIDDSKHKENTDNDEKDSCAAVINNSSHRKVQKVEDSEILIADDFNQKNSDGVETDLHISVIDNSSQKNADRIEKDLRITVIDNSSQENVDIIEKDLHIDVIDNASIRNQDVFNNFPEKCTNKDNNNTINEVPKSSHKTIQPCPTTVENNLNNSNKRSYADVVKAKSDTLDRDCNKEVLIDKVCKVEPESHDEAQDTNKVLEDVNDKSKSNISQMQYNYEIIQNFIDKNEVSMDVNEAFESRLLDMCNPQHELNYKNKRSNNKKNRAKNLSKTKMENEANFKFQNIDGSDSMGHLNDTKKNGCDKINLLDEATSKSSPAQEIFNDEMEDNFNEINVSDRSMEESKIRTLDTYVKCYENVAGNILEKHTNQVLEDINDKSKSNISQMQHNYEIIQDFIDKNEVLMDVNEAFESRLLDMCNPQQIEDSFSKNAKYTKAGFENEAMEEDFIDDIYFDLFHISDNKNETNITDNCQNLPKKVNDNCEKKTQDSCEFQQNLDDTVLENIADLWDIYTKIQDNSDDEMNEISDDEMNENFSESLQESLDREMNGNSDEQITDDEMNENSQDEYEEISDDEIYRRPVCSFLQNVFTREKTQCNIDWIKYNPDEETEESDNEQFLSEIVLSSEKNYMKRKSKLLQPFKRDYIEELRQNLSEFTKHHSSSVPLAEYELVDYFNFEPEYFHVCQSLQYPSSYALAIAEYYSHHDQYFPKYPERCNAFVQKYRKRAAAESKTPPASNEPRLITNTAEILEKIINQKCSVLPTKTAVVLEHVKDLKPIQQAIQYEARKYLTRSQLNRQNRNYIYQSSTKTNRRRNLQRNHSGANNNRKCY